MRNSHLWFGLALLLLVVLVVGCAAPPTATPVPPTVAPTRVPPTAVPPTAVPPTKPPPTATAVPATATAVPATSAPAAKVDPASVARGGLLYDQWWEVVSGASAPKEDHPLWSLQTTNTRKGADTWRCKECHGWDYKGKDGAYGSGSHKTGFPGVWDASQKKSVTEIAAILGGSANPKHNFSTSFKAADITDLANFINQGLIDYAKYVDYATKKPIGGDAARGKTLYDSLCSPCHATDGKKLNFGSDTAPEFVGTIAIDNPQEFLHKVRVGQPGSDPAMPSSIALGWTMQQVVDVLTHSQSLPTK